MAPQEVNNALSLIEDMRLPHPDGALLSSFVTEALNPVLAARYVQEELQTGDARSVLDTWTYIVEAISQNGRPLPPLDIAAQRQIQKRDGDRCCITGKSGTFWDLLEVLPILPIPAGWIADKPGVWDMLGAFFGPGYRDWWLSYIKHPELATPHSNHWLVRKSAADAFLRGVVRLDRELPSMVEYNVEFVLAPEDPIQINGRHALLGDHSRSGIAKIDPRFVGSHARLSTSIRLLAISKEFALHTYSRPVSRILMKFCQTFGSLITNIVLPIWVLFPAKVRITAYNMLRRHGEKLYGKPDGYATVQRLPFGLYLKYQGHSLHNEFNALQMVRRHTLVPVPKPLDIMEQSETDETYLLITRVPGIPLSRCQDVVSDQDYENMALQMADFLSHLRDIPKTINPSMAICNSLGEACQDPRIMGGQPAWPFTDEAAFSQMLRFSDEPSRRGHRIVFTHADLNPRNILIDRVVRTDGSKGWTVSGIVDWETAGYYPEYWDYTKALFEGFRWTRRCNNLLRRAFGELGDYSQELDVETRSWESGDGV